MPPKGDAPLLEAFVAALDRFDLGHHFTRKARTGAERWDLMGEIEGMAVVIEVKPVPTSADVARLRELAPEGRYPVLVARRVSRTVADELAQAGIGFFDTRGRLRLWHRPLLVDTLFESERPPSPVPRLRLETASTLDVALAVLDGTALQGVRATASVIDRSPGTVSKQLASLRAAGLVVDGAKPAVPDLFEAVVEVWRPHRVPLGDVPRPGSDRVNDRLQLGLHDTSAPGWVLADIAAAAAWGAPVVIDAESPPDFYVPSTSVLALARGLFGKAEYGSHACTVAVAPSPYVCRRRHPNHALHSLLPAPSPVVAALDLATDPARGREMLELWSRELSSSEVHRVW